ncbi:hypothetical protein B0H15DRAFT_946859 [Mycena belliarum]|uniref:Uncharacterized protein n=1 Tax=Mycena belliarum TaxID=1033014 RepID=A0AAD6U7T1_9AGAR|nr:hypothetical protein B0H15DRAFT_946859 [Mycena belliae]
MTTNWPPPITSFSELEDYLLSPTTTSLHNALFGVDFHSPDAVVRVRDETVYTNDDRSPWVATFFGQVKQATCFQGNHRTFFLHGGEDVHSPISHLFRDQLAVLQRPVIQDDNSDLGSGLAPLVDRCTDGDRYTGENARNLEVHTAHCGGSNASVWTGMPPDCTVQTPSTASETPIAVGDWVLCEGTLHNRWSPAFDDPRQYELLARRVYLLSLDNPDDVSSSSTLSATNTGLSHKRSRPNTPVAATDEHVTPTVTPPSKRRRRETERTVASPPHTRAR